MGEKHEANGASEDHSEDFVAVTGQWLEGLVSRFGLNVKVEGERNGDGVLFNFVGPDARQLLDGLGQPRGRMLTLLQPIISSALQRNGWRGRQLDLDVQNSRKAREAGLETLANTLGAKAAELGKPITVLGINSFDRRAVHQHLNGKGGLKTESEGDGILRRLKIFS